MPTYFIIGTKIEKPRLYISQQELGVVIESLRNYVHVPLRFSIFSLTVSKGSIDQYSPPNCALLQPAGVIEPDNSFQYFVNIAANEIDTLPPEQALEELQKALDFLEQRKKRVERAFVSPQDKEVTS